MISKELNDEMNNVINDIMDIKEWDMTKAEYLALKKATRVGISSEVRVGLVCDMLATFGYENKPNYNSFYALVNEEISE